MQVPKLEKIVINMGVGRAAAQPSLIEAAVADLTVIAGQKPIVTKAKTSIANFKLREGQAIGVKVTLRGDRMWEFLDRLISVAIPRIRDFRGLPAHSWDGKGNYTFGLSEQTMFAEIDPDKARPRPWDGHHHRHDGDRTTRPARRCSTRSASPSRRATTPTTSRKKKKKRGPQYGKQEEEAELRRHGKESTHQQGQREAEVQGSWLHPLPSLRPGPFRLSQVRSLPFVPA